MPLNLNLQLPGPVTYSVRLSPSQASLRRAVKRAVDEERAAVKPAAPIGYTITDEPEWGRRIVIGLVLLALVALAIAGFAGFRV